MPLLKMRMLPAPGQFGLDPVRVVLLEELLAGAGAAVVLLRIAPAVEDVAAFAVASAGMAGRLRGGRLVIDDKQLAIARGC